jgi:hypothetical protein
MLTSLFGPKAEKKDTIEFGKPICNPWGPTLHSPLHKEGHPLQQTPNSTLMTPKLPVLKEGHHLQQTPNSRLTTPMYVL